MAIAPIQPPGPIARPTVAPVAAPVLVGAREGPVRVVVWFRRELDLPGGDEIACTPAAMDALFGTHAAQRLVMTPETAWLGRLLPREVASALDAALPPDGGSADPAVATPYSHIYLLRLTGDSHGAAHVCQVLGASANVRLVYPEPAIAPAQTAPPAPSQFAANPVYKSEQEYLRAGQGVNVEPAWKKRYTGHKVRAALVDTDASFAGLPFAPRVVPPPTSAAPSGGATPSTTVSTHARDVAGVLGSPDNQAVGIGAAPGVTLVFSPVKAAGATDLKAVGLAFAALEANGGLKGGDVVNVSLAVAAGLDGTHDYAGYAGLMTQNDTPAWRHRLVTTTAATSAGPVQRPAAVTTQLPVEFEPTLRKAVARLAALGVSVVEAAGNGHIVFCEPKPPKSTRYWTPALLGASLAGPWRAGRPRATLAEFQRGLGPVANVLDRSAPTFADGGGIVVSGGQFSNRASGMIDNVQLNHGSRVDCYVNSPNAQNLGFAGSAVHVGGTSICAPVVAGVVAVVQQIAVTQFARSLRPAIVRALLSDPDLGTPTVSGHPVGAMPHVGRLMAFLEKPQGRADVLLKDVQAQQQKSASRAAKAASAAPGTFVFDPYTAFSNGTWQPLALSGAADLFNP